jgi:membrane-bound lytic murein transglycosylase MltF
MDKRYRRWFFKFNDWLSLYANGVEFSEAITKEEALDRLEERYPDSGRINVWPAAEGWS